MSHPVRFTEQRAFRLALLHAASFGTTVAALFVSRYLFVSYDIVLVAGLGCVVLLSTLIARAPKTAARLHGDRASGGAGPTRY